MELYYAFNLGPALLLFAFSLLGLTSSNELHLNSVDENNTRIEPAQRPEDYLVFYQGVEGTPGIDFPIYSHIPRTSFSCKGIDSGYYADLDTDCQVFHICEEERKISFLCPNGTIFQQADLICEWWFKVNCTDAPSLYAESAELLREDLARRKSFRRVQLDGNERNHGAVLRAEEVTTVSVQKKVRGQYVHDRDRGISHNTFTEDRTNNRRENQQINDKKSTIAHNTFAETRRNNHNTHDQSQHISDKNTGTQHNTFTEEQKNKQEEDDLAKRVKSRRYNDAYSGNYLNIVKEITKPSSTEAYINNRSKQYTLKEYHVQFASTNAGVDTNFNDNIVSATTPSQNIFNGSKDKQSHSSYEDTTKITKSSNRGSVRYNLANDNNEKTTEANRNTVAKKVDSGDSDESQITQESSSFIKSSFNSIQDASKSYYTQNPYPNHRTTYSDLKHPNLSAVKFHSTISSVTPQYITTQPINNGKPFLGSRVGANIQTSLGTIVAENIKPTSATVDLSKETIEITQVTPNPVQVSSSTTAESFSTEASSTVYSSSTENEPPVTPKLNSLNVETIYNGHIGESTTIQPTVSSTETLKLEENRQEQHFLPESFSTASPSSTVPSLETETKRNVNHATVYGFFSEKPTEVPHGAKVHTISASAVPSTLSTSDNDQVIIGGSVRSTTIKSDYISQPTVTSSRPVTNQEIQIKFDKNVEKIGLSLGKSITDPIKSKYITPSYPSQFKVTSSPKFSEDSTLSVNKYNGQSQIKGDKSNEKVNGNGFFVTKDSLYDSSLSYKQSTPVYINDIRSTTVRPRPFAKSISDTPIVLSTTEKTLPVTYPTYKISSASPFKVHEESKRFSINPTLPTPFTTAPTTYQNIDHMINTLIKVAESGEDFSSETPRPGLVVPPSVGPQTLHTLAVYFANTLDGVVKEKNLSDQESKKMKEELTTLLTQMTVHGYNQLFTQKENHGNEKPPATDEGSNGIQTESTKNLVQTPEIRQLVRNFSLAIASYLDDPDMFKKDLEDLRPTEPTGFEVAIDNEETSTDEELLNFSDADPKTSSPPQPSPTWGFILATEANDLDVKNSLNPDLNTADSQSFIPTYNNINSNNINNLRSLPQDHWTTSPSATKLWSSTFGVNPASINNHFVTTAATTSAEKVVESFAEPETISEYDAPHGEVRYELRSLPKIALNSTQVHGILIDFMNATTNDDSSRLHRLLKKLNTSEEEFLNKMKEIESNPLTKRLILLLISECGDKATQDIQQFNQHNQHSKENLELLGDETSKSSEEDKNHRTSSIPQLVDPSLSDNDQDVRALQLLNSLYSIASKFGKR